jgi:hypothetical protein
VRPIAISDVLLKAVAACAINKIRDTVKAHFKDLQFGILAEGGADEIVHNLRKHIEEDENVQLVALDATNAFNTPDREGIAKLIHGDEKWKSLRHLFDLEYGQPSELLFHCDDDKPEIIMSETGTRQGSTLGSFYFSLVIHPILQDARKKFDGSVKIYAYIDDITLVSNDVAQLCACTDYIKDRLGKDLGIKLNDKKCEWFGNMCDKREGTASTFIERKADEGIKILGCYLSRHKEWVEKQLTEKMKKHDVFWSRIIRMEPEAAIAVLAKCGVPRMSYYSRVHRPEEALEAILEFDSNVEKIWKEIAECHVDAVKEIAHLPVKLGGLGLTRHAYTVALELFAIHHNWFKRNVPSYALVLYIFFFSCRYSQRSPNQSNGLGKANISGLVEYRLRERKPTDV